MEIKFYTRLVLYLFAVDLIVFFVNRAEIGGRLWIHRVLLIKITSIWNCRGKTNKYKLTHFPYNFDPWNSIKFPLIRFKHILTIFQNKNNKKCRYFQITSIFFFFIKKQCVGRKISIEMKILEIKFYTRLFLYICAVYIIVFA